LNISKSPVGCSASTSKPSSRGPASAIVMRNQEIESSVGAAQEASNDGEGHANLCMYMIWFDMIWLWLWLWLWWWLDYDMIWCDYDYDYGFDYDMIMIRYDYDYDYGYDYDMHWGGV
jgi:hypothetical protein